MVNIHDLVRYKRKNKSNKRKISKLDFIKLKIWGASNNTVEKGIKQQQRTKKWERGCKMFLNHISGKCLVSRIYKGLLQLKNKKTIQLNNGQKTWLNISLKIYKWSTSTWKNTQHLWSLRKCKSKSQWDTTSRSLGWP